MTSGEQPLFLPLCNWRSGRKNPGDTQKNNFKPLHHFG